MQTLNATLENLSRQLQQMEHTSSRHAASAPSSTPNAPGINKAEIKSRLRRPNSGSAPMPEKYRHVSSMVARGMSEEEIANILQLSIHEVRQLTSLVNLAGNDRHF